MSPYTEFEKLFIVLGIIALILAYAWIRYGRDRRTFIRKAKQMGTLVDRFRLGKLYDYCVMTKGEIWECGVYKGGTAMALSGFNRPLRLFDTFEGMPEVSEHDNFHKKGDFKVDSIPNIPKADIHKGWIPDTFKGLENSKIGFAHIDVDIYQSVKDCIEFIEPRLVKGGIMVFDDYGFRTCKGAKKAVDEMLGKKIKKLWTRQAVYIK